MRLPTTLTTLGLTDANAILDAPRERAATDEREEAEVLCELLDREVEARRARSLRTRMRLAHLPFTKTLDQFDFSVQPSIDERQIRELRTLRCVHDASTVIFLGPPGIGKTPRSVALAIEAIQAGFSAYVITAHDLVTDLGRASREGRLDRQVRISLAPTRLVLEEMGSLPLEDLGALIVFQLVSARSERGSILLTSTKSSGEGGSLCGDPGQGLLAEDLHPSLQGGDAHLCMEVRGRGHDHRIQIAPRDNRFPTFSGLTPKPVRQTFGCFQVGGANHHQLRLGKLQKRRPPAASLQPRAHDTHPHGERAPLRGPKPLPIP